MRLNSLKSFVFPDNSGYCSKCGITFVMRSFRLRTSYLRVLSFISLLMNPHPNFFCIRNKTSARSWFCPTQKLGFVSHPIKNLSRLEKDTEKHPSPSEKPEIYSFTSLCFVFSVGVLWRVIVLLHDSTIPVAAGWRRPKSIRGQFLAYARNDFPRYSPAFTAPPLCGAPARTSPL